MLPGTKFELDVEKQQQQKRTKKKKGGNFLVFAIKEKLEVFLYHLLFQVQVGIAFSWEIFLLFVIKGAIDKRDF